MTEKPETPTLEEIDESPDYEVVEEGEWTLEYKDMATRVTVYNHMPSNTYWAVRECRSGSYYSDYHYEDPEVYQVIQQKKIVEVTEYVVVQ